jgi:hypothetical protein
MKIGFAAVGFCLVVSCSSRTDGTFIDNREPTDAPQYAEIDCFPDGTVIASAARQNPPANLAKFGICTVTTGGGNPTNALFGTVTCTSAASTVACTDDATTCFTDGDPFGPPGSSVTASWTGHDVPAGSANPNRIPGTLTVSTPPTSITPGDPLSLELTAAPTYIGEVRIIAGAPHNGSTMNIECLAPAVSGTLTVPGEVTAMLESGTTLTVNISNGGIARVPVGDFEVVVVIAGDIIGPQSFSIAVE